MGVLTRRSLLACGAAVAAPALAGPRPRLGLVRSDHKRLTRPVSPEAELDYEQVRDMVWRAISCGRPRAGSLEAKIRPGAWVVLKPNIVSLRPRRGYRTGDITDMRVLKAVLEYVASRSRARRITIAEGGSYRGLKDPATTAVITQNGRRVDALTFDWGDKEWNGFSGTLGDMIREAARRFPDKSFDYVDLAYDAVRDPDGRLARIEVPRAPNGVGAFSSQPAYYVTHTITQCDFLITIPVLKVHNQCGITCCLKNYVGTAPRIAYAPPEGFSNLLLHKEHSVDFRIDPFIVDLAAFHPPDYAVIDAIRGLQYSEHDIGRPDQMVRTNAIIAGEDAVACDALAAHLIGFNAWDMEFLHMAQARLMGQMDLGRVTVDGDDPVALRRRWAKPRLWYGRGNRAWRISAEPERPVRAWQRISSPTDTLEFARWLDSAVGPGTKLAAAVTARAPGPRKAFLWIGADGRLTIELNGQRVAVLENETRYRVAQFRQPVELRSGDNLLRLDLEALSTQPRLSLHLVSEENDGDSLEEIRWLA